MNNRQLINDGEEVSIKKVIIVIIIILAVLGLFYFITTIVVNNRTEENNKVPTSVVVDPDSISFGQLLTRPLDEYYVLASTNKYSKITNKENSESIYTELLKKYNDKEDSLKVYSLSLDDSNNKKFVSISENITDDLSKIKVTGDTLFKIKNKHIVEHYSGSEEIMNKLEEISNN